MVKKVFLTGVVVSLLLSFAAEAGKKNKVGKSCKLHVKEYRGNKVLTITLTYLDDYVLSQDEFDKELAEEAADYLEDYQVFHVKVEGHWDDTSYWRTHFSPEHIYIVQKKKQYEPEVKAIKSGRIMRGAEKEGLLLFDKKLDMTKLMKIYYAYYYGSSREPVKKNFKIERAYFSKRDRWRRMRKARGE